MYKISNIHLSLDHARRELKHLREDALLRREIENELGENFWPEFKNQQRGLLWRNIITPDNSFCFFLQCSHYLDVEPLGFEFLGDTYVSINEEKKGLGKLRIILDNKAKATVNIMDLHKWNKKSISEIVVRGGESLIDFHHNLLNSSGYKIELRDNTSWTKMRGKPEEWYYFYLLHFVAHGVLFETFSADSDIDFLNLVVFPTIKKIESKFGHKPIIVSLYPDPNSQTDDEDFYSWSFPSIINKKILEYIQLNNLTTILID